MQETKHYLYITFNPQPLQTELNAFTTVWSASVKMYIKLCESVKSQSSRFEITHVNVILLF